MDRQGCESGWPMRGKNGCTAAATRVRALLEICEGEPRILGFVEFSIVRAKDISGRGDEHYQSDLRCPEEIVPN